MSNPKIIICSTFRDFNGSENDKIQKFFLKSLESQTNKNFELVVTLFGEKNVEREIKKHDYKSVFYNNGKSQEYRYSLTKVVLNAVEYAEKSCKNNYVLLWTTCDVIYEPGFFEKIVKNYKRNLIGTSHPNRIYSSLESYKEGTSAERGKLSKGFDVIYFDKHFLGNSQVISALKEFRYYDWGVFEHFLIALNGLSNKVNMLNLYEEVQISKIENNRKITKEPSKFLIDSHRANSITLKKFLRENGLSIAYFNLVYCHLRFRVSRKTIRHYIRFFTDIMIFAFKYPKMICRDLIIGRSKN